MVHNGPGVVPADHAAGLLLDIQGCSPRLIDILGGHVLESCRWRYRGVSTPATVDRKGGRDAGYASRLGV